MKATATEQLEQLRQEVTQQRAAQRDAELEAARTKQAYEQTKREHLEAVAEARSAKCIRSAETAVEQARAATGRGELQRQGVALRLERAAQAADAFEREHAKDLLGDMSSDAEQARVVFADALQAVVGAHERWHVLAARSNQLAVAAGGQQHFHTPSAHGLEQVVRDVRRAVENVEIPAPLPHFAAMKVAEEEQRRVVALREERERGKAKAVRSPVEAL